MSINGLLAGHEVSWLNPQGKKSDVVLACGVRLARNLLRLPFPKRADLGQLAKIQLEIDGALENVSEELAMQFDRIAVDKLTPLQQSVLVEKRILPAKMTESSQYRTAYIREDTKVSIFINEDDHINIQSVKAGLDLEEAFQLASKIDDFIESKLDLAFDESMGYLTAYPTNLGTGLRAAVILHLPGLVYTRNMDNIVNTSPQLGLAVRPLFDDEHASGAHLFQISNQLTLGFSEEEILDNLRAAVGEIVAHERRARKALFYYGKDSVEDGVWRAYGILSHARVLSEQEVFELASKVRLGIERKLINTLLPEFYGEMLVTMREGYLKYISENENLSKTEIDRMRATKAREILTKYKRIGDTPPSGDKI